MNMTKLKTIKLLMVLTAVVLTALSVSLYLLTGFGADSVSVFNAGLARTLGVTVGMTSLGFYFIVIIIAAILHRSSIGIGTLLALVVVGPGIDVFSALLSPYITPETPLPVRLAFFFIGFSILAFAVALFLSARSGISPADILPVMVSEKAELPFRWCKVCFDVIVVGAGIALGGAFGAGTVLMALCSGPAIQFLKQQIEKRLPPEPPTEPDQSALS